MSSTESGSEVQLYARAAGKLLFPALSVLHLVPSRTGCGFTVWVHHVLIDWLGRQAPLPQFAQLASVSMMSQMRNGGSSLKHLHGGDNPDYCSAVPLLKFFAKVSCVDSLRHVQNFNATVSAVSSSPVLLPTVGICFSPRQRASYQLLAPFLVE